MANILIIDDDTMFCRMLCKHLGYLGHSVSFALTLGDGIESLQKIPCDLLLLDVQLPDGDGLQALPVIQANSSNPEIIIITGEGDPDGAALAMSNGVWDYLEKPLSTRELNQLMTSALQYRKERGGRTASIGFNREKIVGESVGINRCLDQTMETANSDTNVLLIGETGSGKGLFARTIHENSVRKGNRFVVVDCAVLSESLAESALFGHEKGAFTGADRSREGLVGMADNGTLFLDEVGELTPMLMKKCLRVLEEGKYRPLGSGKELKSDFRLISATNQDLDAMARAGTFRRDLLFRLGAVTIKVPPLRDRPQDIEALFVHNLARLCEHYKIEIKRFAPELVEAMSRYDWPGNVRELIHAVEKMIVSAKYETRLYPRHLPEKIRVHLARASVGGNDAGQRRLLCDSSPTLTTIREVRDAALNKAEHQYLQELMKLTGRNIKEACRISGLGRTQLYHLLKKYKLTYSQQGGD